MRLLRLFLPESKIEAILEDSTRLSAGYAAQLGGHPDDYRLLDLLPDFYPYFLFHPPQHALDEFIRKKYAPDYRTSLHQLVLRPPRNLGLRLRAFRLQHDLTLVQTAALLGLSKSELHRIERSERSPSAPAAFRILRLLTTPSSASVREGLACPERSRRAPSPSQPAGSARRESPAASLPRQQAGRAGYGNSPNTDHWSPTTDHSPLNSLRRLWLSGPFKTRELANLLDISQPHLIRLLRGDRVPSKKLLERIERLTASPA